MILLYYYYFKFLFQEIIYLLLGTFTTICLSINKKKGDIANYISSQIELISTNIKYKYIPL